MKSSIARSAALLLLTGLLGSCRLLAGAYEIDTALDPNQPTLSGIDDSDNPSATPETIETVRQRDPQSGIGADAHPKILQAHGGAYRNEKLEDLLALITGALVSQAGENDRAYNITVLDSPEVNAFALPGGYLYVTRGLLALANDASEVAAVLAHEMAHVSSNHGLQRSRQNQATDIAARVASEIVSNPVAGKFAEASTKRRLATFSQRQELQADAVGIKLVGKTGYDPFGAPRFLKSMERYSQWRSAFNDSQPDMTSSHPSTPRRIEIAKRHARAASAPGEGNRDRDRFLIGIEGLPFGDRTSEGAIRGNRFIHPDLDVAFSVPRQFDLTNQTEAVLAAGPGEQALRFDAVDANTPADPAAYLKSGWVNGLLPESVAEMRIDGMQAAEGRAEAGDWQFSVIIVARNKRYYRFILAAPRGADNVRQTGLSIARTFGPISKADKALAKPLSVNIVAAKPGDTVRSMSARMRGVKNPEQLFRALNGLNENENPVVGQKIKLIL